MKRFEQAQDAARDFLAVAVPKNWNGQPFADAVNTFPCGFRKVRTIEDAIVNQALHVFNVTFIGEDGGSK